jgi:hypothetical protein
MVELGINGRIILKWMLHNQSLCVCVCGLDFYGLRQGPVVSSREDVMNLAIPLFMLSRRRGETMSVNSDHWRTYCSSSSWHIIMENHGGIILTGKTEELRGETRPSATLSITNRTWIDPNSNTGLRGERLATNRLRHGTDSESVKEGGGGASWRPEWLMRFWRALFCVEL